MGLFAGSSAFAQTAAVPDGNVAFASPADDAPGIALQLSQPPAPEATASFYDSSHKDLRQSLAWMQETNTVAPTYWNLYTEARIRLQMQDYPGARATAEQAYKLAIKALPLSQAYVTLSAAVVAKAQQLASR
ncbi:hypothetical protein [Hymenobacter cheonanensis]|uniref:hypothetical protein n=1 Tax=Hymenobacter sp. CA2-7 TaxID=3063993 RepID=UPI002712498A|nr:hypothetical protein [Hymenobacter sp. CA2-7]MDO7884144.1 hypothetical protein [Hymenobacter sp. CA2-7]